MSVEEITRETKAHFCLDCTVCTGSCPIARSKPGFSPRMTVRRTLFGRGQSVVSDPDLWSCLTCGTCSSRCPLEVDFPEFVRRMRTEAIRSGNLGIPSHDGLMQIMADIQASGIPQAKLFWLDEGLRTKKEGGDLLYVGCLPFYGIAFEDYGLDLLKTANDAVRVLNALGVEPALSEEERCCGHDQFWRGEFDKFSRLAQMNLEVFKNCGAERVIFICPEGYQIVKEEYPKYFGELPFKPVHLVELLTENLSSLKFKELKLKVTYHDSCRMGRFLGIYDAPRKIMESIPGIELVEMERTRANSLCCGASGWTNCFGCSKQIQIQRLEQARRTGAELLVTNCPKCQIHFRCAMKGGAPEIEMTDMVSLVSSAIEKEDVS
jgi:heterodisulfide reductase subunit D